ncbi:RHS repeat-associated core domain-containing protein [Marinoscillum sp. MHG1-6]|uniref:RHS repeat-associated core domain-containing protein n=1 Tax=Marinoscillum sp. MHG1-6 TaxID=2959627 RepID=UPI002157D570|nr:RHS repeat-associated core domain-containing protein [Marinoscillum sp. MHG1-6]
MRVDRQENVRWTYLGRSQDAGGGLDEETGLYYYGARYYEAKTSVWLSVDPKAETYQAWSPYNYTLNNPVNYIDPNGEYVSGDKTTGISSFMVIFQQWQGAASDLSHRKRYGRHGTYENKNHALIRIFDTDFRATNQIVNSVGGNEGFSYNKSFGKYVNAGLPLDVAHFFKMANLAQDYPDFAVRMAYVNEEFNQSEDPRPAGRTSAFSPEDLFSNELGLIFGSNLDGSADISSELQTFLGEVNTLFTTNNLNDGKYLTESRINRLRGIAEKYYGTSDLRNFQKDSEIYSIKNIRSINKNASDKSYPFYKGFIAD